MFQFIAKIRQRRRERKDCVRYLQCPKCRKKFWGELPTGGAFQVVFQAHCPRCQANVSEENITLTRRQVAVKWSGAVAKAAWHCLIYPVKPLSATKKIVKLEAVVVKEIDRVEKKIEIQGEMIGQRLDLQDGALAGIGGMLSNMAGGGSQIEFITFKQPRLSGSLTSIVYRGNKVRCCSIGGATFVDTEKISPDYSHIYFFICRSGKAANSAMFDGDGALTFNDIVARLFGMSVKIIGKFVRQDLISFFESAYVEISVQGNYVCKFPMSQLLSGSKIVPFEFSPPLIVPGGRSFELSVRCGYSGSDNPISDSFMLQIILHGEKIEVDRNY